MIPLEIERKFLINPKKLPILPEGKVIDQGYFTKEAPVIRVSLSSAWRWKVTFKGNGTLVRPEYEYRIPEEDAKALYKMAPYKLRKTRYEIGHWEVDYIPKLKLWMAEIELKSPKEKIILPGWVTKEVTEDKRYYHSYLAWLCSK